MLDVYFERKLAKRAQYLTLTQCPYDPGTLPSSANQCILRHVCLRSNLSRKQAQIYNYAEFFQLRQN